jgi:toxin ParE1/3/4
LRNRVVFTPEAEKDLNELFDYIADRDGRERAFHYIERIEDVCTSLRTMPERGTAREDLRPGLRLMGFERRAVIAFQVGSGLVAILRILYGGRSIDRAFPKGKKAKRIRIDRD